MMSRQPGPGYQPLSPNERLRIYKRARIVWAAVVVAVLAMYMTALAIVS